MEDNSFPKRSLLKRTYFFFLALLNITLILFSALIIFLVFSTVFPEGWTLKLALIGIAIVSFVLFIFFKRFLSRRISSFPKKLFKVVYIFLLFFLFGFFYLFQPAIITNASVGGGKYKEGQLVLGERISYLFKEPKIGDIVTFVSIKGRRMGQIYNIQEEDATVVYLVKHDASEDSILTKDKINSRIYWGLPFKKQNELSKKVQELTKDQTESQKTENIIQGSISWNQNVEEISPSGTLSLMNSVIDLIFSEVNSKSVNSEVVLNGIKYYKVGTWQTGKYQGNDLIDVIVLTKYSGLDFLGAPYTHDEESIGRVSVHDDHLIIFLSNSYSGIFFYLDYSFPDGLPDGLAVYEKGKIPDLFYSYPVYIGSENILFPVQYQGKTKQFIFWNDFQQESKFNTTVKPGYKFLTTFSRGQKIYVKNSALNPVKWDQMVGNLYYAEDLDHSMIHIYWSVSPSDMFYNITWIKQPDFLNDVVMGHEPQEIKSVRDIDYYCKDDIDLSNEEALYKLLQSTMFNLSEIELVATSDTHQIYRPTNADIITRYLYNGFIEFAPSLSYKRYINSFPILIYKDAFGAYELMFRSF